MYAEHKGWALNDIEVTAGHNRIDRKPSHDGKEQAGAEDEISCVIRLHGDLDPAQRKRLLKIATRCWVHRTLSSKLQISTTYDRDFNPSDG